MMNFFGWKKGGVRQGNTKGSETELLRNAVDAVFNNKLGAKGNNLFESAIMSIVRLTGASVVLVGKYQPEDHSIATLAYWDNGEMKPNFTYFLANTVSDTIVGKRPCSYVNNVCEQFPMDRFLNQKKISGYVGVPLFYSENQPMGLLAVMFDHSLDVSIDFEIVLKVFSIRMASEIEHLDYNRIVEKQTNEMNLLLDQLKTKNKALDSTIIELEKARAFAEESNQLKTAFLANLSHEVRTPMNVMLGFAELLKSEVMAHDERIEYIDIINQNGFQLLKIMDNLIEISKFQSKRLVENPRSFYLNQLLVRCYDNYCDYVKLMQKPIDLIIEKGLSDGTDYVLADQEGIFKVLDQLLDNAVKFTHEGSISFGYKHLGKKIRFTVSDTGIGVPDGMEEKIFDMFRQVDLRASREFGGNGLGLAIARKYSELMNGKIWVESRDGHGAVFCFEIPYRKAILTEKETASRN